MTYGLPEYKYTALPERVKMFLESIYACRDNFEVVYLPDYSLVYAACKVGARWVIVTDHNAAFNLSGFIFYPSLCDNRPDMAKKMAQTVCLLLNLQEGKQT